MDFRDLVYLDAIDRHRSLTYAAEELHISQPALTKFLKNLEKNLGTELFRWTGYHMVPTKVGKLYLDFAKSVLSQKAELDEKVQSLTGLQQTFRVGICLNAMSYYRKTADEFTMQYPNVRLSLIEDFSNTLVELLINGEIDLAFSGFRPENKNFISEKTAERKILLYIPPCLPVPATKKLENNQYPWVDLKQLEEYPFAVIRSNTKSAFGEQNIFRAVDVHPKNLHYVKSLQTKVRLAQEEGMLCFLVLDQAGRSLLNGFQDYDRLYTFGDYQFHNEIYAVYPKKLQNSIFVKEFIRLQKE